MTRTVRFSVPVPDRWLSPNVHVAWQRRAPVQKRQRLAWYSAACAARVPADWNRFGHCTLDLAVRWCTGRRILDDDNFTASCKHGRDSLADAQLIAADTPRYLVMGTTTQTRCPRGCHCGGELVVTLTSEEQAG